LKLNDQEVKLIYEYPDQDDLHNPFVADVTKIANISEDKKKALVNYMAYYKAG